MKKKALNYHKFLKNRAIATACEDCISGTDRTIKNDKFIKT